MPPQLSTSLQACTVHMAGMRDGTPCHPWWPSESPCSGCKHASRFGRGQPAHNAAGASAFVLSSQMVLQQGSLAIGRWVRQRRHGMWLALCCHGVNDTVVRAQARDTHPRLRPLGSRLTPGRVPWIGNIFSDVTSRCVRRLEHAVLPACWRTLRCAPNARTQRPPLPSALF